MADEVVSAAEIARLAGVGRAAVSNWRARHTDFPRPVGGSPTSPVFSRAAVEAWLTARGRSLDGERPSTGASGDGTDLANVVASLLPSGPPGMVLDPACGSGTLLAAAARRFGAETAYLGQDADRGQVAEAHRALAEAGVPTSGLHTGSPMVDDALSRFRGAVDAVVCAPPARAPWPADEPAIEHWAFGSASPAEPYLAWLQLCYAYLKPGGVAVVTMPFSAAVRGTGRRVRAELLRAGALRRVIALPDQFGMSGSWQLWVLVRPAGKPPYTVTMTDLSGLRREEVPTDEAGWRKVSRDRALSQEVEGIELLDEDVLLLPSRHVEAAPADVGPDYDRLRTELTKAAAALEVRLPALPRGNGPVSRTLVSVMDLVRLGAITFVEKGGATRPGDVIVPTGADRFDASVVGPDGRPHVAGEVLRCDHDVLDPYFLACFLRSEANRRGASGTLGGTSRLDLRRARIPRLPLAEQHPYAAAFRALADVTDRLDRVNGLAAEAVQKAVYGLTSGVLAPPRTPAVRRTREAR